MAAFGNVARGIVVAAMVIAVAELSKRSPRYSALLLSLPVITILAITMSWLRYHDLELISAFSREMFVLVILSLPLFLPLIYCKQLGLGFWQSLGCGIVLASVAIGAWLGLRPTG
jgi:hypothetical protein